MKRIIYPTILLTLICFAVVSCGPSPEEIEQMTIAAYTDTPVPTPTSTATPIPTPTMTPTPTPTPLPYGMELNLVAEGGESVTFGVYVEVTGYEEVMMDESGAVEFSDLPGPDVEVSIKAQGYEPHMETVTLERGNNQVTLTLTIDPLQINPATACAEGQKVLLIEDFEDQQMQNWEGLLMRPLFEFVEIEGRGTVLKVDRTIEGEAYLGYPKIFGNMVWHYDILREPENGPMWMRFHQSGESSYIGVMFGGQEFGLQKTPGQGLWLANRYWQVSDGETWEKFSLVYFDGMVETWINDELFVGVTDNDPHVDGNISIAMARSEGVTHLDNLIICELTEPYAPPVEEVVEE